MNIDSMLRVDHAGEWGAVFIYRGQAFVNPNDPDITHMLEQEKEHLAAFTEQLIKHNVRPSWLQPIWAIGGFTLGALTAALGKRMAHTCTIAVEQVIEDHYAEQKQELGDADPELKKLIDRCAADEAEHRARAHDAINQETPYPITSQAISWLTKTAIEIAKKI